MVQVPDFQTFMFDWSGRVSRTVSQQPIFTTTLALNQLTKILLPVVTVLMPLLSAQPALASKIDLVCKYQHTVWVMTDMEGVKPPWGLMKRKEVATHPDDTKDISLQLGAIIAGDVGLLTQDAVSNIPYSTKGNQISYDLERKLGGIVLFKYSYTLDRVSGQLDILTKVKSASMDHCKKFITCDAKGYLFMPQYKFDWTIKISGTIEIEAETGDEASDLFLV